MITIKAEKLTGWFYKNWDERNGNTHPVKWAGYDWLGEYISNGIVIAKLRIKLKGEKN